MAIQVAGDGFAVDTSEVAKLAHDLSSTANASRERVGQAVQQAAINTSKEWKKDTRQKFPIKRLAGRYERSVSYDLDSSMGLTKGEFRAEIGPDADRDKVGKFGALDDPEGRSFIGRAPSRARQRAEVFASRDLEKGIEIAVDQTLKAMGL